MPTEFPSADAIATAIVAACRETGENPEAVCRGDDVTAPSKYRARHFAVHALRHCFQDAKITRIVVCCGWRKDPGVFWNYSRHYFTRPWAKRPQWWTDDAFGRVIAAVEAVDPGGEPPRNEKKAQPNQGAAHGGEPEDLPRLPKLDRPAVSAVTCRPVERLPAAAPASSEKPKTSTKPSVPTSDRPKPSSIPGNRYIGQFAYTSEKQRLADMLAEAVRNTAALQKHLPSKED